MYLHVKKKKNRFEVNEIVVVDLRGFRCQRQAWSRSLCDSYFIKDVWSNHLIRQHGQVWATQWCQWLFSYCIDSRPPQPLMSSRICANTCVLALFNRFTLALISVSSGCTYTVLLLYRCSYLLHRVFPFTLTSDNFFVPITLLHPTPIRAHRGGELWESTLRLFLSMDSHHKPWMWVLTKSPQTFTHSSQEDSLYERGSTSWPSVMQWWLTWAAVCVCVTTHSSSQEKTSR